MLFQRECNKQQPYCKRSNYNIAIKMDAFGKWLFDRRKAARMTQGQVAKRAGISTSYVSTLEREERHHLTNAPPRPAIAVVESIAKALDAPADEARLAAGYAPQTFAGPPTNAAEFLEALDRLGVPGLEFGNAYSGLYSLPPEEYEKLLQDLKLVIDLNLRRHER